MIHESILTELRGLATKAAAHTPIRFVDCDPRILLKLLDEVDESRVVQLKFERKESVEPALRD